ncbi:MAG: hypothetical protein RLZZ84_240 [Pseudomonadota bacterium]|jgi:hypothetical protein
MALIRIEGLPDDPLAAAAHFYGAIVPQLAQAGGDLLLAFPLADHAHRGWRVAAVQALARAAAPRRINAVAAATAAALASAEAYLAAAPGVTGQYWPLDDAGAGLVLSFTE